VLCDRIRLEENLALGQRVRAFAVQARVAGTWQHSTGGTTIGARRVLVQPAVALDALRVNLPDTREAPTLASVELFLAPETFRIR